MQHLTPFDPNAAAANDAASPASRPPWSRVSLTARLALAGSLMLLVVLAAVLASQISRDLRAARAAFVQQTEWRARMALADIADQAVLGDAAAIRRRLERHADTAGVQTLRFVAADGQVVANFRPALAAPVPPWFARLTGLEPRALSVPVAIAGHRYGELSLQVLPAEAMARIWARCVEAVELCLLATGLMLALLITVTEAGLAPLRRLVDAAHRLGEGEHDLRVEPSGPREFGEVAVSFNRMADRLDAKVQALREGDRERRTLAAIVEHSRDAIFTKDLDGRITSWNSAAAQMFGYSAEQVLGNPVAMLDPQPASVDMEALGERIRSQRTLGFEAERRRADGTVIEVAISVSPQYDDQSRHIGEISIVRDITEERRQSRQLDWQSCHDTLTGLLNRAEFERRIDTLLAQRTVASHALLLFDLDSFKVANDSCGRAAGDDMLRKVARLALEAVGTDGFAARFYGDEFGLCLEDCDLREAERAAAALCDQLRAFRFTWQGKSFATTSSVGVSLVGAGTSAAQALAEADAACHAAKQAGGGRVRVWRADDGELAQQKSEVLWVSRIHAAIAERRFRLMCQPIVALRDKLCQPHYEVLLRMVDEHGKEVAPFQFIPSAERYGLMPAIDRLVVDMTFEFFARHWGGREGEAAPNFSINLSGASITDEDFLHYVEQCFSRHEVPTANICFEVTETAAIAQIERAAAGIAHLRGLGCKFSLDDFGSGMASFAYLKSLPLDYLKIDGAFVKDMASNRIDFVMVEAFNRIGKELGLATVAEFVDGETTAALLRRLGVDYAQGYGVGRPLPMEQLVEERAAAA
ncbi:MAG: EAL domain-containing protein [Rhodocyclaceae bacterium]|nr:EAL domain-containing protein [Rhodocyclaceae bacterium]MBX3667447.1 EAL domain-containing protein [Rhodocyclaceae bacterium]